MKISPLMQNSYTGINKAPSFQSTYRYTKDENGNIKNCNTTWFFRDDLDWDSFASYLGRKYENEDKVNIVCYGCSDGSEPMSTAVLLGERFGYDSRKFFPIIAKDKDEYILNKVKTNNVRMYFSDIDRVVDFSHNNLGKYFIVNPQTPENDSMIVQPTYELKSKIKYAKADITEDIHNLPSKNTVLMCRNLFPYIKDEKVRYDMVETLASRLRENCVVVIGDSDKDIDLGRKLENAGFAKTDIDNVYESRCRSLWA